MKLSGKEAYSIVCEDHNDWEPLTPEQITGKSRWAYMIKRVFRHIPSGKTYLFEWSEGATEQQEQAPYEYEDETEVKEVIETEVTLKQWVQWVPIDR